MKENSKVLMIVNTEFGLLTALLYYLTNVSDKYEPHFVLLKSSDERFQQLNLDSLPGKYEIFIDELNSNFWHPNNAFMRILKEIHVHEIVFQNPLNFITNIIVDTFRKSSPSMRLTALSDGLTLSTGISAKNKFKLNLRLWHRKYINRFKGLPFLVKHYKQMLPHIDLLIAHENHGCKHFLDSRELFVMDDVHSIIVNDVFSVQMNELSKSDVIFFTQPILNVNLPDSVKNKYKSFLKYFSEFALKNKINVMMKVHPSENVDFYMEYTNKYVSIDQSKNIPAEIILNSVSDKIILSMFSSVSLCDANYINKHIWTYKLIDYKMLVMKNMEHIYLPADFGEFENMIFNIIRKEY